MADFRKWIFAFALVALLLGAATANAQNQNPPFACQANAGTPTTVRVEGITELVGDLLLICSGGTPTALNQQIPLSNLSLTLNTNVTSKLLGGGFIDALLTIDEPFPANPNPVNIARPGNAPSQKICFSSTGTTTVGACNYLLGTATGGGIGTPTSPYLQASAFTVYVGRTGANLSQVTWLGVPLDAPGSNGQERIVRLTNIRGNACQLGLSSTLIPTQIVGFVAVNGSQFITINNPQQTLAYIQQGLIVGSTAGTEVQCNSRNLTFTGGSGGSNAEFAINVREGFAASFKRAQYTGSVAINPLTGPSTAGGVAQNIPGNAYNTETAFQPDLTTIGTSGGIAAPSVTSFGQANFGTRILIRLNNVNSGARIFAPTLVPLTISNGAAGGNPPQLSAGLGGWTGGFLQIVAVTADASGNVGTAPPSSSLTFGGNSGVFSSSPFKGPGLVSPFNGAVEIPVTSGTAALVYEVVNADPFAVEQANIPFGVAFTSNTANNLPAPGVLTANASFAPLSTVNTWDASAPIPRFCDQSTATNLFTVNICTCNLLFPFVTQAPGFDTGIAIANTTVDPFGTTPQTGTVSMYFYGSIAGGGAVPTSLATQTTTGPVPAGQVLTYTTFGGAGANAAGLQANPGFTGYMIAVARFQYCHGFAFISDLGAQKLAEGYLAIQLDVYGGSGLNRTGVIGEVQGH